LNLGFVAPGIKYLHRFSDLVKPLIDRVDKNKKQILTLENLRNILLPKLMSGEVRIPLKN